MSDTLPAADLFSSAQRPARRPVREEANISAKKEVYSMNAQNIVAILILVVVCIFAVRSCLNKKAHGCFGSGEAKLNVRDKSPDHYR